MRSRRRDNAGVSRVSWKKHGLLGKAAWGQACAYHITHPTARCLIVDMHAGTGEGIILPQLDFWEETVSFATPALAMRLATKMGNSDVILCEQHAVKRKELTERFPDAIVLADHAEVPTHIRADHQWALVMNDPCGIADHGIDTLETIASLIATDWLIVFNEHALHRYLGMEPTVPYPEPVHVARIRRARANYIWMENQLAWAQRLGARHMARSHLVKASGTFHYRIFVLAHTLSQALRPPIWEILQ